MFISRNRKLLSNLGKLLVLLHGRLGRIGLLDALLRLHAAGGAQQLLLLGAHLLYEVVGDVLQDGVLSRQLLTSYTGTHTQEIDEFTFVEASCTHTHSTSRLLQYLRPLALLLEPPQLSFLVQGVDELGSQLDVVAQHLLVLSDAVNVTHPAGQVPVHPRRQLTVSQL